MSLGIGKGLDMIFLQAVVGRLLLEFGEDFLERVGAIVEQVAQAEDDADLVILCQVSPQQRGL